MAPVLQSSLLPQLITSLILLLVSGSVELVPCSTVGGIRRQHLEGPWTSQSGDEKVS